MKRRRMSRASPCPSGSRTGKSRRLVVCEVVSVVGDGGGLLGSCRARGGESLFLRPFFLSAVVTYVVVEEEVAVVVVAWAHTAVALMVVVDVEDRLHKRTR